MPANLFSFRKGPAHHCRFQARPRTLRDGALVAPRLGAGQRRRGRVHPAGVGPGIDRRAAALGGTPAAGSRVNIAGTVSAFLEHLGSKDGEKMAADVFAAPTRE